MCAYVIVKCVLGFWDCLSDAVCFTVHNVPSSNSVVSGQLQSSASPRWVGNSWICCHTLPVDKMSTVHARVKWTKWQWQLHQLYTFTCAAWPDLCTLSFVSQSQPLNHWMNMFTNCVDCAHFNIHPCCYAVIWIGTSWLWVPDYVLAGYCMSFGGADVTPGAWWVMQSILTDWPAVCLRVSRDGCSWQDLYTQSLHAHYLYTND